ncbi:MAG: TetR family transcriptional regulator [Marmoricola sp.]|nr:TetR family transcriptional regulator [Marmoricola sp.]
MIVDAAAKLVAEQGFDALSMRRLAKECGVGVMTLYGYVRTKDEVLQALANRLLSTLELSADDDAPWDERVAQVVRSLRSVFLAHPELLPIAATQRLDGEAAYRGAEALFGALSAAGLAGEQVTHAFYALTSFTIGSVQREVGLERSDGAQFPGLRGLSREEFPQVIELAGHLVTANAEATFNAGLELLIAGIAAMGRSA